jgi:hypothetical protein
MPRIPGTTNAQTTFLRAFRKNPLGPPPDQWPSAARLRCWLRRSGFRRALQSLEQTLRVRADFLLTTAATRAADHLTNNTATVADDPKRHLELLRLLHVRQRFTATAGNEPANDHDHDDSGPDGNDPASRRGPTRRVPFFEGVPGLADELLQDTSRLKAYMELGLSHGDHRFNGFLKGFPEHAHLDVPANEDGRTP